jgi:SAM-dependent methyltransferase
VHAEAVNQPRRRAETPLRRLAAEARDGCWVVSEPSASWVDGGERDLSGILANASDLSSLSDELAAAGDTWVRRYHLARERGNIVRPLALHGRRVLEIGAGCGGVTRRIGEMAGIVDALEPTPARAAAARLRTRDLPSVEVFVGDVHAVPREPAYDAVILIGVLEYVGGADEGEERAAFLREAAARLRPGGTLVCAIENRLGVKYLAGAPEDHSNLPFEGLEEYPHRGPYRTFARRELEQLFLQAGLTPRVLHVFPDYKLPRIVFTDSLLRSEAAPLAWRVPGFPSYDAPLPRGRLASEYELWRGAVRAGLGDQLANSFVVLAGHDQDTPSLWAEDQHAVFYTVGRRARFTTETRVLDDRGGLWLRRRVIGAPAEGGSPSRLVHAPEDSPFIAGQPLEEALERADEEELARLLRRWREHVEAAEPARSGRNADAAPSNVVCRGDELVDIDVEWRHGGLSAHDGMARALLHLAPRLADARPPEQWPPECETVGDLLDHLAALAHLDLDRDRMLTAEAELQAEVVGADRGTSGWPAAVAAHLEMGRAALARPLRLGMLGLREPELRRAAEARLEEVRMSVEAKDAEIRELWKRVDHGEAALRAIKESRTYRLAQVPRRIAVRARRRTPGR